MTITVKHVDAFTDAPMQGNPAGVVLRGDGLTDGMMQGIAAEMRLPETAFVLPPTATGADMRLRWFTPVNEVPLCGHATVAAFHAIVEERLHGTGEHPCKAFRVETRSGILPVTVESDGAKTTVSLGLPLPHFRPGYQHRDAVLTMLQLNGRELDPTLPIMVDKYLYVPVLDRRVLFALHPDLAGVDAFQRRNQIGGVCVFTTDTIDKNSAVHSRFFCPADGVNEDVVTGSANGPLGVYLVEQGVVRAQNQHVAITGEQGDCLGRRGRVSVSLGVKTGKVVQVDISGRAVTVFTAEMRLR